MEAGINDLVLIPLPNTFALNFNTVSLFKILMNLANAALEKLRPRQAVDIFGYILIICPD
jgi:hypothetical protein